MTATNPIQCTKELLGVFIKNNHKASLTTKNIISEQSRKKLHQCSLHEGYSMKTGSQNHLWIELPELSDIKYKDFSLILIGSEDSLQKLSFNFNKAVF